MVANNSGGEKSLEYGKVKDFVNELHVVFADGLSNEHTWQAAFKGDVRLYSRKACSKRLRGRDLQEDLRSLRGALR